MDLGNLVEIVVYYLLIRGMTCLGHWDGFPMVECTSAYDYTLDRTCDDLSVRLSIIMIH